MKNSKQHDLEEKNNIAPPDKPRLVKLPCCLIMLLILGGIIYLSYYIYQRVKDPLYQEWEKNKQILEEAPEKLMETTQSVKDSIEQGKEFIEQVDQQAQQVKETYEKAQDLYEKAEDIKTTISDYTQE